jgi:hypothetical protein
MTVTQFISGPFGYSRAKGSSWKSHDIILKIVYLSLQMVDLGLTVAAGRYGWSELNPFMKAALSSPYQLAIFKFGIPVLIGWLVPGKWLIPAILLLCGVVGWNVKELIYLAF